MFEATEVKKTHMSYEEEDTGHTRRRIHVI
jgi:hypothetical protein